VSGVQWTVGGVLIALALVTIIIWLGRDRKMMKVRVGFFLERERFAGEERPSEGETKIMGPWPGEKKKEE
jgi:hypothetical protein